jgi:spore coat protein U-like protein
MSARRCLAALAAAICFSPYSWAATHVRCSASAGGLAFGVYNPLSAGGDTSTESLTVTCDAHGNGSATVSPVVTLSTGLSGSYVTRTMFSGVNPLSYNIYLSTAYNQVVGDGTGGSVVGGTTPFVVVAGGSSVTVTLTFYGLIPASQNVLPGSYSDLISLTVTY